MKYIMTPVRLCEDCKRVRTKKNGWLYCTIHRATWKCAEGYHNTECDRFEERNEKEWSIIR